MSQRKSKIVLFAAVTIQTMLAGILLAIGIPIYLWGPTPTEQVALDAYARNAEAIARLIAAVWAGTACVTYYLCFIRQDSRRRSSGDASKTSTALKRD